MDDGWTTLPKGGSNKGGSSKGGRWVDQPSEGWFIEGLTTLNKHTQSIRNLLNACGVSIKKNSKSDWCQKLYFIATLLGTAMVQISAWGLWTQIIPASAHSQRIYLRRGQRSNKITEIFLTFCYVYYHFFLQVHPSSTLRWTTLVWTTLRNAGPLIYHPCLNRPSEGWPTHRPPLNKGGYSHPLKGWIWKYILPSTLKKGWM